MHMAFKQRKRIAGVTLAAGMSTRMGTAKQLLMFQEKPLLAHVIANARAAACLSPLIVVLGHQASMIQQKIDFGATRVVIANKYQIQVDDDNAFGSPILSFFPWDMADLSPVSFVQDRLRVTGKMAT